MKISARRNESAHDKHDKETRAPLSAIRVLQGDSSRRQDTAVELVNED
jgi:hypothetical protein